MPEALFDMDYPGHYMRRIKSVSLTIPCVTGPYTSVNCTMTISKSKTRLQAAVGTGYTEQDSDPRFAYNFAATDSIATSTAENDSGMFEVSFHDERYLPFEGSGAVSEWRLDMPKDTNAFDFETITDVVLNLLYTARDGGDPLRRAAKSAMSAAAPREAARFVSLRHEFPSEWYAFLHPPDATLGQSATLALPQERFPFLLRGKSITVDRVDVFLLFKAAYKQAAYKATPLGISLTPPGSSTLAAVPPKSPDSRFGGVSHNSFDLSAQPASLGGWQLQLDDATIKSLPASLRTSVTVGSTQVDRILPDVLEDMVLVLQYSAT
jgi:Tc toxin complex TcA C-terminal TcB-binding domain